jgi:hypothetical protein
MKRGPKGLSVGTIGFSIAGSLDDSGVEMTLDEFYAYLNKNFQDGDLPATRRRMERRLWDLKMYGWVERVPGKLGSWRLTAKGKKTLEDAMERFEDTGPFGWDHKRNVPVSLKGARKSRNKERDNDHDRDRDRRGYLGEGI